MKFNNFQAVFFHFFFLFFNVGLLIAAVNLDLDTITAIGLGTANGVFLTIIVMINQFYYRRAPKPEEPSKGGKNEPS